MGDAVRPSPMLNCHNAWPVLALSATRWPSSSPENTTPPAVETVPVHMRPYPVIGYSQARLPVFGSMARRITCPPSSVAPPPAKFFIGVGSLEELVNRPHCSKVRTYSRPVFGL